MNFLCQSGMFFLHVFITKAWDSTLADERFGVMAPTVLASDRPLSESTDAGGPPKRVGSNEASIFFSASHAGLWHCKTNPMLHLVKTKPKKGNNNLDRTNLHEKRQFFWANLGNETNLYFPMGGGSRNQTSSADLTTMFRHVVFFAAPWQLKKRKR